VNIQGLKGPFVVHGVQHIFHPPVMLKKWPGKDKRTRIVFITRGLDETALRNTLKIFTAGPESVEQPVQRNGVGDSGQADVAQLEDSK
ncbi:GTP-binding protein, partial [Pelagibius sp.]|uniref:GTP-binding protein n=1 Tax=Pelagibius sp. TaxID=1931238 RepID=UPI00261CD1BC